MNKKTMVRLALIFSFLIILCACSNDDDHPDDFSSSRTLFLDHISAVTTGQISRADPIRITFVKAAGDSLAGTEAPSGFFEFSPSVKGTARWENDRTIIFEPEEMLDSDQRYQVTTHLDEVIPAIERDKREFRFMVETFVQNFEVTMEGLRFENASETGSMILNGVLRTADVVKKGSVSSMVRVTQHGRELPLQWMNAADGSSSFRITGIRRSAAKGTVVVHVTGDPIGVDREEKKEIEVPATGAFYVMSTRNINGEENYISILFSEPLDPSQDFEGLVRLDAFSTAPRLVVDVNELKIYPAGEWNGSSGLTLYKGIDAANGQSLADNYTQTLEFRTIKPEVRLVGSDQKSILPTGDQLIFPFEAVGLKEVDVTVVKIFSDNVLQYLQVNPLGGQSELRRVAQPVVRKVVALNSLGVTDLHAWNRYNLKLDEIMKAEPGAIYQIKIGFRQQEAIYACENQEETSQTEFADTWESEEESSFWDDYQNYYSPEYNWEERDNPCSASYYGGRRDVSGLLLSSDLGILAKRGDAGELFIAVSSIRETTPVNNAKIQVYDYQQRVLSEGSTGTDGLARLEVSGKPFALVVTRGDEIGYLKIDDGSALSLSNFDVSGKTIRKGLKGFLYGERGVWRPQDTVHLALMLEDEMNRLPEGHPVILEFRNPNNQLVTRQVSTRHVGNIYRFDLTTSSEAPTGNWEAEAKVGDVSFRKKVRIEAIKPNRLKLELDFDQEVFRGDNRNVTGDLAVRWLSGATASNIRVEYEMELSPAKTTFDSYPNFTFDDVSRQFFAERRLVYDDHVNEQGQGRVTMDLGEVTNAPGALNARFFGKAFEEGGDFSISNQTVPYYPYTSFVGVKIPDGDKRGILLTDKDHSIQIATVDSRGNPLDRSNVKVELYKLDWKWWWDNSYDNISNYVSSSYHEPIQTATISTSKGEGRWNLRVDQPEWGRYFVRVTDPVSGHSAGEVIYIDWPGWAGKGGRGDLDGAAMLDFSLDKEEYAPGETMKINIPSTEGNRILVSLETGSKVLNAYWKEADKDNTPIEIEVTDEMAPNVYVHLTMIQPHEQTANDLPVRLYGVKSVKVVNPKTVLEPQITMPGELRPEQSYTISISEKNGHAMAYTVAVVDEGLLDITGYHTPDPWKEFYVREALGVKTWDVYDDVIGAYGGRLEHLLAIGGDDELAPAEQKEVNRFKPVVRFLGPFALKTGETRKHRVTLPQYIGSVKTMVLAAGDGAYGQAEEVTPVNQPMMILATMPRVAGPGESIKLPVNVFAMKNSVKNVMVKVETEGVLDLVGESTQEVNFTKPGDKVIYFDLRAQQRTGYSKVSVSATSQDLKANYDVELNIIPRNPFITSVERENVPASGSWSTSYEPVGLPGENQATLEVSGLPPLNLQQRLNYLIRYPHGCLEQTVSSVFAQLYLSKLTDITAAQQEKIQNNITSAIAKLPAFQLPSGGFTYWPGNGYPNNWASNYAGHFLLEARKAGYAVPEGMLAGWRNYQQKKANAWGELSTEDDNALIQAYRLYTLSLTGDPALGAMNRMKETPGLPREVIWRLALAYQIGGYTNQAKMLVKDLPAETTGSYTGSTFGSTTRDQAMILETLEGLGEKSNAYDLLVTIAEDMGNTDRWMSTQTTAYCLLAIARYADQFDPDAKIDAEVILDGEKKSISSEKYMASLSIPQPDKRAEMKVQNNGKTPVFVRLVRSGIPIEGTEKRERQNIAFEVNYTDLNGDPLDVNALTQGTNFKVTVNVRNPGQHGTYKHLALTQLFPSGWEIINSRLEGTEETEADYMDIRDDRVMHYFDLSSNESKTFSILLNAAYRGSYYLPAVTVGAMYDPSVYGSNEGHWVEVKAQ